MDQSTLKARIIQIESKREVLLKLLEQPNLGTIRVDVNQALEELDELIFEFREIFPENKPEFS
ncbi:hypothetical protein Sta7437_1939 [Stanieria cyanosphaera PCC 7437]|uniref:Uncharacterized protein n=1 Tax=Stanieria cyanosphaera (strain ATCC 29371 / PCC 7437) TaxID=111780 RepID=K9XTV4_STAC7|nr:hypothetical protein [Stanieria cyanosphaera]AFZ35494.1 hypothetical protein Sta7437_1939 [Stanieria cyanosphaera PCC 7437]